MLKINISISYSFLNFFIKTDTEIENKRKIIFMLFSSVTET